MSVTVTDNAYRRIAQVLAGEAAGAMLRVAVKGGGCSGFQYVFDIDATRNGDDLALTRGEATVLIDETSMQFLDGCTIDFVDDLIGQSFKITNPNASASCGCGTSFAV